MKKALIITDYTYDFVADNGKLTAGKSAQRIDASIAAGIREYLDNGGYVFVVNDLHFENDEGHPEHVLFPPHNINGTEGRAVYGESGKALEEYKALLYDRLFYIDKFRYSCFEGTPLDLLLRQKGVLDIEICGVCTDICVLHTAISAYNLGYYKTLIREDRVASFNPDGHVWALSHFKNSLGFKVIES